jgi:hypothetical protein
VPCCNESSCASNAKQALDSPRWRRALGIALAVNAAVMLAAAGVFGTGTGWPDVIVAAIMGGLGIVRQARTELTHDDPASPMPAGLAS